MNCQKTSKGAIMPTPMWHVSSLDSHVSLALYLGKQKHRYLLEIWNPKGEPNSCKDSTILDIVPEQLVSGVFHFMTLDSRLSNQFSLLFWLFHWVQVFGWQALSNIMLDRAPVLGGRHFMVSITWYLTDVWSAFLPKCLLLRIRCLSWGSHSRAALKTSICCQTLLGGLATTQ